MLNQCQSLFISYLAPSVFTTSAQIAMAGGEGALEAQLEQAMVEQGGGNLEWRTSHVVARVPQRQPSCSA